MPGRLPTTDRALVGGKPFRLADVLDHFIPGELLANAETHRRARMFMLSHLFGPVLGNTIPLYMYVTGICRDYRVGVFFLLILAFWAYPFALKATGRYQALAFVSVQNLIVCVLWACFAFGGMTSPFLPWMLIFPLLAFLYLPPRGWVRNVLLAQIFGSSLGFIALLLTGVLPLPYIDLAELQTIGMISMASVAIYFAMMSLYFAKMFREQGQFARELNSLVSTSDNLRELTAAANQASRAKADFVAGMSHELRTPLNAIIGYSNLLFEEAQDEGDVETQDDIGHVRDAGTHLLGLIDDILTYSRIEAGKMPVNPTHGDLAAAGEGWRALVAQHLPGHRMTLACDAPRGGIVADWSLLALTVRHFTLGIAAQHPGSVVAVRVAGAPDGAIRLVFDCRVDGQPRAVRLNAELFEDAADASATKYGGTGIELPLAQMLVALLDGTVVVPLESHARIVISLPPALSQPLALAA